MNMPTIRRNLRDTFLFASIIIMAASISSNAQGRGNGRGGGPKMDKKCAKFVNCHDARDGRWDGRGPAINQNGSIPVWQPPVVTYPNGRARNRNQDDPTVYPRSRDRRVRRNSDDDVNRDDHWRRRRNSSDNEEVRERRTRRRDRNNVID